MKRTRTVVVLGGGVAGTGAALAAARAGARVVLLDGGTGASSLSTGAIDEVPWTGAARPPAPIAGELRAALDALDAYTLPDAGSRLATTAGILRVARGLDRAILDLARFASGMRVGVVRCDRPEWDGGAFARAWGEGFDPLEATLLRHADERLLPAADFAARHDDEGRVAWLGERLREAMARAGGSFQALLLPPSLGVERARAGELSARVGVACGEACALPGGPSGLRFEHARERALDAAQVERKSVRGTSVHRDGHHWRISLSDGPALQADAVVLALGGLVGGGVDYSPGEAAEAAVLPPASRAPFRLAIDVPAATLGAHGRPLETPGSLFGSAPEGLAWPFATDGLMERVGVLVDEEGRAAPMLYAAGELLADAPRTWLGALHSGVRAGSAAAGDTLISTSERSPSAFEALAIRS